MSQDQKTTDAAPADGAPDFKLERHPLFQYIKREPGRAYVFLYGYIADVTDKHVHLYPGLEQRVYYKIPEKGIAFAEKACQDEASGPTKLVVDAETMIDRVGGKKPPSIRAGVLSGAIIEANLWRARARHPGIATEAESRAMPTGETPSGVPLPLPLTHSCPACTHKGHCFCDPFYDYQK
jgi:hypothetical protein